MFRNCRMYGYLAIRKFEIYFAEKEFPDNCLLSDTYFATTSIRNPIASIRYLFLTMVSFVSF